MRSDMVVGGVPLNFDQPEGCVANVLSLTTPQDVCRLSAVSPIFKSAAESDVAWQRFLPNDLESILSTALDGSLLLSSASSKKEVYFSLCDNPIIVDHGRKFKRIKRTAIKSLCERFSLEKKSGKICYVLSARDLVITWGDTPVYWKWKSNSDSRFAEVAELINVCRLEIIGKINTRLLSPATLYTAYLVFKFASRIHGLDRQPVDVTMKLDGGEYGARTCSWNAQGMRRRNTTVTVRGRVHYPKERGDGWLEMELGDFFSTEKEDGELEMRFFDDTDHWKRGLIVEGIEIRPKDELMLVLPNDLESILSTALDGSLLLSSASSKKEVYFSLCDNPIIVDHGRKSFSLEKKSGKICYVLSARDLVITWGDTPVYWEWKSNSDSRFAEVAELIDVCRLEILGKINTCLLSPATLYTAYLVFKFASRIYGLYNQPVDVTMKLDGGEYGARTVSWNARGMRRRNTSVTVRGRVHYPKERGDGWLEMELGDFFSTEKEDGELEMRFFDDTDHWKRGLIVEGIEIRPKDVSRAASPSS
ncbi:PREDICTED: putative F-box protein PP2-B2 isoform X2 [Populus euphratica]|uniref:F-box protein PP2-B2 isoform X2 n=1 Tax=Populus euphratica TaxID=75702 RepID=A0AAJ6UVK5_POPEU|nr:PREDICTED: putative F-box protein PP2-B2 isoform X2 [Populus euphratica]